MNQKKPSSFKELMEEIKRHDVKRRLKAAFRRKPKASKPNKPDSDLSEGID